MKLSNLLKLIIRVLFAYLHKTLEINRPLPTIGDEDCLPEEVRGKLHDDWPWPISLVPRSWTVVCGKDWPKAPDLLAGDSGWTLEDKDRFGHFTDEFLIAHGARLPIPKPGHWVITAVMYDYIPLPYFAITFKNNWHFRIGALRWDETREVFYEIWTIALHKIDF